LLRREDPERVTRIHTGALEYYRRSADDMSRIELLYHRLALGQEPQPDEAPDDAIEALGPVFLELPPSARRYLESRQRGGEKQFSVNDTEKLQRALLEAFPNLGELQQLTEYGLGTPLDEITSGTMRDRVFGLISWAKAEGRLGELAEKASARKPGNLALAALVAARRGTV
jgi:effector-associated domain 1 (EAD1)-containing protein